MTGPEHYQKAEELAATADNTGEQWFLDLALFHASMAQTAAIAMSNRLGMPEDVIVDWDEVCRISADAGEETYADADD